MIKDGFRKYSFFSPPANIEYLFEGAWETLKQIYPNRLLLTCDALAIGLYNDELEEIELNFLLGEIDSIPHLQAFETKEAIRIKFDDIKYDCPVIN